MTFPSIHLNGTSKASLEAQYRAAANAVREAIDTVAQNGPHGRDYYVQTNEAYSKAVGEHKARLEKLRTVAIELEAIWSHVAES